MMAFAYVAGLASTASSTNDMTKKFAVSPILQEILPWVPTQSGMSRFFAKPFNWLAVGVERFAMLQAREESRLLEGDLIALDDTKIDHPYGRKIPLLFRLFDAAEKRYTICMNLLAMVAVRENKLEYPLFWRFWQRDDLTKIELAEEMFLSLRQHCSKRLWVAMDRWFLCKEFFLWLEKHDFDWVTKAKRNTAFYKSTWDSFTGRQRFVPISAMDLIRDVWPFLQGMSISKQETVSIALCNIYAKFPTPVPGKRKATVIKQVMRPLAVIAVKPLSPPAESDEETTYRGVFLLISNRLDAPDQVVESYAKRWRIEVFFRNAKQELGLANCQARNENAHFAHVEMLFFAETLISYSRWLIIEEGAESVPSHREMIRSVFNALCRIECFEQSIQVHFGTEAMVYASLIQKCWPTEVRLGLWNIYPSSA